MGCKTRGDKRDKPVIGITVEREGEYLTIRHQYPVPIREAGGLPVLLPHGDDVHSVAEEIDGLVIPGGEDIDPAYYAESSRLSLNTVSRERTDFEINLLKAIMARKKPVLGICYGMQLINVALGGSLYQDIESQIGADVDHRKGSHRIQGTGPFVNGEFMVNTSHHQAVRQLGGNLEICAVSDDNLVEAFSFPRYPFLIGVQWHPERSDDDLSRRLFKAFVEGARVCK